MKSKRRKIHQFKTELQLWNFESAVNIIKEFEGFPKNAFHLTSSLMTNFGNLGSQRTGYAYIGIPKTVLKIMEIASPWIEAQKGGMKPKAIAVT